MKNQTAPAQTPAEAPDEHAGHGGSYVVDEDGVRRLVERTAPPKQQDNPQDQNEE